MVTKRKILKDIITHFGSQTRLAQKLGVTLQYVNGWCNGREHVPLIQALKIEKLTDGKFKASEIVDSETRKYLK